MDSRIITLVLIIVVALSIKTIISYNFRENYNSFTDEWSYGSYGTDGQSTECHSTKCQEKIDYLTKNKLSYEVSKIPDCNGCSIIHYNNTINDAPSFTIPKGSTLNGSLRTPIKSTINFTYVSGGYFLSDDKKYAAFVKTLNPAGLFSLPPTDQYLFFTTVSNGALQLPSSDTGNKNAYGWYGLGAINMSCIKINNPIVNYSDYPLTTTVSDMLMTPVHFTNKKWGVIANM